MPTTPQCAVLGSETRHWDFSFFHAMAQGDRSAQNTSNMQHLPTTGVEQSIHMAKYTLHVHLFVQPAAVPKVQDRFDQRGPWVIEHHWALGTKIIWLYLTRPYIHYSSPPIRHQSNQVPGQGTGMNGSKWNRSRYATDFSYIILVHLTGKHQYVWAW